MEYQEPRRKSVDYLSVPLPSNTTGIEGISTLIHDHDDTGRASRMDGQAPSVAAHLRNKSQDLGHLNRDMFQDEDDDYGDEDEMEGPELNLTSWTTMTHAGGGCCTQLLPSWSPCSPSHLVPPMQQSQLQGPSHHSKYIHAAPQKLVPIAESIDSVARTQ